MSGLTLGSLFDGSGAFPLAGKMNGITPLWASEIEPFPIRVTTKRLPEMKHCGDISRINGAELSPVDIITFGSPCTNLSTAGRREGLIDGEQSVLFFEAIRIMKEMREATNGKQPRFILWENVPGAYTSSGGQDFARVLQEIVKIKDETLSVPMPPKRKWLPAGEIVGDGFSVAYRTINAQYFGVPQRRLRCYLVADFAGECASDVLFERESVSWNITPCGGEGKGSAAPFESGVSKAIGFEPGATSRLGGHVWEERVGALRAHFGDNQTAVVIETSDAVYAIDRAAYNQGKNAQFDISIQDDGTAQTILAKGPGAVAAKNTNYAARRLLPLECSRLQGFPDYWREGLATPKPTDKEIHWWSEVFETHRKKVGADEKPKTRRQIIKWLKNPYSDGAEYKMWGNGCCLPCAVFALAGIVILSKKGGEENA